MQQAIDWDAVLASIPAEDAEGRKLLREWLAERSPSYVERHAAQMLNNLRDRERNRQIAAELAAVANLPATTPRELCARWRAARNAGRHFVAAEVRHAVDAHAVYGSHPAPPAVRWLDLLGEATAALLPTALPGEQQALGRLLAAVEQVRHRRAGEQAPDLGPLSDVVLPAVCRIEAVPTAQTTADEWLPISVAAERAGLTLGAARHMVRRKRGRIEQRQVGGIAHVRLSDVVADAESRQKPRQKPRQITPGRAIPGKPVPSAREAT